MPAYIVFHNRVVDPEAIAAYLPKAGASMAPYGAEIVVLEDESQVMN